MNFVNSFPLLSAIFIFGLGLFVFLKNYKSRVNLTFFLLSLPITVWLFGTFMMFMFQKDKELAIFWDRFVYLGVVFMPVVTYHFGLALINKKRDFLLYAGYALSAVFLFLSQTKYFVDDLFVYSWGVHTKAQFFHHIFLIYFFIYVILFFVKVFNHYRSLTSSLLRAQFKYIFFGFLILYIFGPLAYLPAYGIGIYPFAYLAGLVFVLVLSYAIVFYRLMGIKVVYSKFFTYLILLALILFFYYSSIYLNLFIFDSVKSLQAFILSIFTASIFALLYLPISGKIRDLSDNIFYKGKNPRYYLKNILEKLGRINDLKQFRQRALFELEGMLNTDKICFFIFKQDTLNDIYEEQGRIFNWQGELDELLIFRGIDQATMLDDFILSSEKNKEIGEKIKNIGFIVAAPIKYNNNLIGVILAGEKTGNKIYSKEDLDFLDDFSKQISFSLHNACEFENLRDKNKKIISSQKNFLYVAGERFRTPLFSLGGIMKMALDDPSFPTDKQAVWKSCLERIDDLKTTVDDTFFASRIADGNFDFEFKPIKLKTLLEESLNSRKDLCDEKNIKIKFNFSAPENILVWGNKAYLEQVFLNLFNNAIEYAKFGEIAINIFLKDKKAVIEISDTGIGISEDELPYIFDKFYRGENAKHVYSKGLGLGLFVVKKIIEKHEGKVYVIKTDQGRGTKIAVELNIFEGEVFD